MCRQFPYKEDTALQLCQFENVFPLGRQDITRKIDLAWSR